jgi:dolichol-phosphate mannosyltransferase
MLSIITPAFNEASNLEAMRTRLTAVLAGAVGDDWEWLVVDDHSADATFDVIRRLSQADPRIRGVRLSRNSGSHTAVACGLHHVRGDAAVMLAGDLQDPPELLQALLERWRAGAQVVWATRRVQPGEAVHAGFAAIYYWIMRRVVGMQEMPARGADVFLVDRAVIDAFERFPERHGSVFALLTWLGFTQAFVEYDKQPRAAGRSGWTRAKKINLVVDSVTAFSAAPIRACTLLGGGLVAAGVLLMAGGLVRWMMTGAGHLTIMLGAMAGLTGVQLVALGLIGEYVWRGLEESRRRPAYVIEAATGANGGPPQGNGGQAGNRLLTG